MVGDIILSSHFYRPIPPPGGTSGDTGHNKNPSFLSVHVDFFNGVRYTPLQGLINKRRFVMPSAQKTTRPIIKIPPPPPAYIRDRYLFHKSLEYSTDSLNAAVSGYRRFRESFTQASIRLSPPPGLSLGLPLAVPADGEPRKNTAGSAPGPGSRNSAMFKFPLSPPSPRLTVNHRPGDQFSKSIFDRLRYGYRKIHRSVIL